MEFDLILTSEPKNISWDLKIKQNKQTKQQAK